MGFAFFWLLLLAYAYFIPQAANFNTESRLFVAFSIVDHHSLAIDSYHRRLGDESYYRGHYYSDKAPGLALLAVPAYAALRVAEPKYRGESYVPHSQMRYSITRSTVLIRYAITYVLLILPSAVFGVLLWLFLAGFTQSDGLALLLAGVYSLGTIAYVYSTQLFSHQFAAILLFSAFLLLYAKVRRKPRDRRVLLFAGLAGLLAGYAFISEYPAILIACLLGLYAFVVAQSKARATVAFFAGVAPPVLLNVLYNVIAFGKPFATGYAYVHSNLYQSRVHAGVFGLANPLSYGIQAPSWDSIWQITFGTYRGIFLISPVLLLFFAGVGFMWKRRDLRPEFWLCLAIVVLYFLMDASRGVGQNGWSGGWSVASRHLTPILPFMAVPMALGLRSRIFRVAFLPLATVSVAITFMAVAAGDQFSFAQQNPLVKEMLPHFFGGTLMASWGSLFGLNGLASLVPLAVLALALTARLVWLLEPRIRRVASRDSLAVETGTG